MNASHCQIINERLPLLLEQCTAASLRAAMAYSVNAGGKRMRPLLLLAACEAVSGEVPPVAVDFACALEMIHTYSLIHDDLPAMDNDDLRRGKPTSHKQFGEALAILAGDALLNRAYETMANACTTPAQLRALCVMAAAAGDNGMIAGQAADIAAEGTVVEAATLDAIHRKKTGALFAAALEAGALLGGADEATATAFAAFGETLGAAFQMLDDLLDETASPAVLGKPVKSDAKNHKNTYVTVHGLEHTKTAYANACTRLLSQLETLPQKTNTLRGLVQHVLDREF